MEITAPPEAKQPMQPALAMPREPYEITSKPLEMIKNWVIKLPDPFYDAAAMAAASINKVFHRSTQPGSPIPTTENSWKFSVLGDFGVARNGQRRVAENIIQSNPALVLTTGDNVYEKGTEKEYKKHFDPPDLFGNIKDQFPVFPSLGNHDIKTKNAKPYFKRFPELDNARYYTFAKDDVRFIVTDSNETMQEGSTQRAWMESVLSDAKEGWKVLVMHHPMLSALKRSKGHERYTQVAPLLAKHGVDLVLAGHDHAYERTKPLNDHGTVQITTGGGGRMLYPYTMAQPDWSAYRHVGFGHVELEVTPDALIGRYILGRGKVQDTFRIEKAV